jgi:hypothetical protein
LTAGILAGRTSESGLYGAYVGCYVGNEFVKKHTYSLRRLLLIAMPLMFELPPRAPSVTPDPFVLPLPLLPPLPLSLPPLLLPLSPLPLRLPPPPPP